MIFYTLHSRRLRSVESHICQNRADMGHPSLVTGRERQVCEKSRLEPLQAMWHDFSAQSSWLGLAWSDDFRGKAFAGGDGSSTQFGREVLAIPGGAIWGGRADAAVVKSRLLRALRMLFFALPFSSALRVSSTEPQRRPMPPGKRRQTRCRAHIPICLRNKAAPDYQCKHPRRSGKLWTPLCAQCATPASSIAPLNLEILVCHGCSPFSY